MKVIRVNEGKNIDLKKINYFYLLFKIIFYFKLYH